jgi:hypothetical protein
MVKFLPFPLCILIPLVTCCGTGAGIPLEIDRENGVAILSTQEGPSLHFSTWLNGTNMTLGAHVFRNKGNLVAIHSLEEMDLVITCAFDSTGMILSAQLVNSAKEKREVSELSLVKMIPLEGAVVSREGALRTGIVFVPDSSGGFCLETAVDTPWNLELDASETEFEYLLDLSSSSLTLLPGERIRLPSVRFDFHPCKEISLQ